jgi:hypothetical protein
MVLKEADGTIFWTYPAGADEKRIARLEQALARRGVEVLAVRDEDRERILAGIETHPTNMKLLASSGQVHVRPIRLDERRFWMSREYQLKGKITLRALGRLISHKLTYEARSGFDEFAGQSEAQIPSEAAQRFLFDPMSVRGKRMLDIGFAEDRAHVHLRFRGDGVGPARDLVNAYLKEFDQVWQNLVQLLDAAVSTEGTLGAHSKGSENRAT